MAMRIVSATLSKPSGGKINGDALGYMSAEGATGNVGCWVVADGQCGRSGGGNLAAQASVLAILDGFAAHPEVSSDTLLQSLQLAQQEVLDLQEETSSNKSMRVSAAVFCANRQVALWAHIGNVRIYAFRNGELIAQTQDHSIAQAFANSGEIPPEELRSHGDRRRLLRCLGIQGTMHPDILADRFRLLPEDLFLICSDGFWEHVSELEMQADWCKSVSLEKWLEHMQMRLLKTMPTGYDDYSAIALRVTTEADL